jgi:hypothetical protein
MHQVGAQTLVNKRIDVEAGGGGEHRLNPWWWFEVVNARAGRLSGLRNNPYAIPKTSLSDNSVEVEA